MTRAIYGQHWLWTVLLKMNRMYPWKEAWHSHCKTMFIFRIWCKKFLVMYPCENCCECCELFCSASFMAKKFCLISRGTFYLLAHDNVYFISSHWWPHFLPQFSITFSPKQVLLIFSHKWLIGLWDQ